jgi:hypothetical protein
MGALTLIIVAIYFGRQFVRSLK